MSCLLEHFEDPREVGVLELVAAASQGRAGRGAQALDHGRRLAAQVDHVAPHEAFDAEPHPQRLADGLLRRGTAWMIPHRLALMTLVGPPLCPMMALPWSMEGSFRIQ